MSKAQLACGYCGRPASEVGRLFAAAGGSSAICDTCVQMLAERLEDTPAESPPGINASQLPRPREIKAALDEYVVGHDAVKETLAVAVYSHFKRILFPSKDVEIRKSNILLVGPTGSGKTLLAETLARILQVPFSIADATTLTQAGYVGDDVENILLGLILAANGNIALAERGIIYIDEIDKVGRKGDNPSLTRDVSGEGVQQALLKIIEGTLANVPPAGGRKHPEAPRLQINTRDILFICGGTFEGLDDIIKRRRIGGSLGFNRGVADKDFDSDEVQPEDLMKFGLIPELVGRLPVIARLQELDRQTLIKILTEPKNSLVRQYQYLFSLDGVELEITPDALEAIADIAIARKTGARGLRSVLERVLRKTMYDLPSQPEIGRCVVDAGVIRGEYPPKLEERALLKRA